MKLKQTLMLATLVAGGLVAVLPLQAQNASNQPAANQPAASQPPMRGGPGNFSIDGMAKRLDLTDDQKAKVQPVMVEMQKKNAELMKDTSLSREDRTAKRKEIRDAANVKLKEILTPEQYAKWEKMGLGSRRPAPPTTPATPATPAAPAADDKAKN